MKTTALSRFVLLALGTTACVSAKHVLQSTPSATIANRLPPLEVTVESGALANTDGALPEDPIELFQNEIHRNVAEPTDTATFGYAKLLVTQADVKRTGRALQAFQMMTMLTPSLFGVPLETYKTNLTAEVQITDARGIVLGKYIGKGQSSVQVAMYYGYSQSDAPRLSDMVALRGALAQIRPQLDSAATRLRPLLLAAGAVDNPTLPGQQPTIITDRR